MSEYHDSEDRNNEEVVSDEVLEHVYSDLAELRELLERNRAVTELTQALVLELRKEVQIIKELLEIE